jgi:glycerol-3-phosphate acyltransferase PlsY
VTVVAALAGYLVGSIPTAELLGRLRGVDLRSAGSGNPGTANALKTSGLGLAALVLSVEAAKGLGAVWMGQWAADEAGAVAAGLGAVAGNVYNVWYRFQGGKGLGISLGVLIGLWPWVVLPVLGVIVLGALISRSSGLATLVAIASLTLMAWLWLRNEWSTGGVETNAQLLVLSVGIGFLIFRKHWRDSMLRARARR